MIKTIQSLLDRSFIIGFFLPVLLFLFCNAVMLEQLQYWKFKKSELLSDTSYLVIFSWFCGILLSIFNWRIIRIFEGYGKYNPLALLVFFHRWKYRNHVLKIKSIQEQLKTAPHMKQTALKNLLSLNQVYLADHYPNSSLWILGTGFGNIIRAFEVYPKVMYGAESIYVWDRLMAIVSKEYLEVINQAKSKVDFWVNLAFLSVIFTLEVVSFEAAHKINLQLWIYLLLLPLLFGCSRGAKDSAREWGISIKSAFDMYLPDLREKLNLAAVGSKFEEWESWSNFSAAISHRDPSILPAKKFEVTGNGDKPLFILMGGPPVQARRRKHCRRK